MTAKPITIIGGGLAGLTLGIGLRQRGVPVTVWEAGHYPRHRVCGEFISGRGQDALERLGLRALLESVGAVKAATAAFFSATQSTPPRTLPAQALCLSRYTMDRTLADEFCRRGGELREGRRWRGAGANISGSSDNQARELPSEGVVHATGRRLPPTEQGVRWFGVKAHARNVALTADLEMHVSPRGYVGLCRVDGGAVNVCGLFRRHGLERGQRVRDLRDRANEQSALRLQKQPLDWLGREPGTVLHHRLALAEFDNHSVCAVAGLSLRPQRAAERSECCIGDAITMIPPVTGNGMSMAFESAEMALAPLAAWSAGEIPWAEARQQIARRCDAAFSRRLAWAKWLQRMILAPWLPNALVPLVARSEWFWRTAFERTR